MMAMICSSMRQHERAIKLYKNSLQYVWYLKDKKTELKIYERLGFENYQIGDIYRAQYYHQRSVQFLYEDTNSPSKTNNTFLRRESKTKRVNRFPNVDSSFLNRLGISYDGHYDI